MPRARKMAVHVTMRLGREAVVALGAGEGTRDRLLPARRFGALAQALLEPRLLRLQVPALPGDFLAVTRRQLADLVLDGVEVGHDEVANRAILGLGALRPGRLTSA